MLEPVGLTRPCVKQSCRVLEDNAQNLINIGGF